MKAPHFPSLFAVLRHHAAERPHAPALRARGEDGLDYATLEARVEVMARNLALRHGVTIGHRVAYLGLSRVDQIVLLFALARLGALLAPLNHRLAQAEWRTILADCAPSLLVHDGDWRPAANDLAQGAHLACAALDSLVAPPDSPAPWPQQPSDAAVAVAPALLVYTSGTTGRPRGAVHTQAHLLANMAIAAGALGITPDDRIATMLPLFHVGGLCIQTLPALYAGASVVLLARFDADAALHCFAEDRPTLTVQVPATMKALIEHPRWAETDLSSLRAVSAGSSVLPTALIEAFHARGVPVCNVYGATETGPYSVALHVKHAFTHVGSCGWPAAGNSLQVEMRLQPLPAADGGAVSGDSEGEVLLRGPNVVARYWPDQPTCDADGWFHSGDIARRDPDGSIRIVGRSKDLIISGGENIHPAEIEHALAEHPWVAECAVVGLPDDRWGEAVTAVVVFHPEISIRIDAERASNEDSLLSEWELTLNDHLAGRIARFKLPRHWVRREQLPRTALGKVQKGELRAQVLASVGNDRPVA